MNADERKSAANWFPSVAAEIELSPICVHPRLFAANLFISALLRD
jgi:hypothetical protein